MPMCIHCKHGDTMETSHEWIDTRCEIKDKWVSPFHAICDDFELDPRYKEDETDERKPETD